MIAGVTLLDVCAVLDGLCLYGLIAFRRWRCAGMPP